MTLLVFVDSNVLYARTTRDWLLMLRAASKGELFRLQTSLDVLHEVGARLRDDHPEKAYGFIGTLHKRVAECVDEMVEDYPGGRVPWIADDGDWHVHHAAVHGRADILLSNDRGFASEETPYEALTCDEFFCDINRADPRSVREVLDRQLSFWAKRGASRDPADILRLAGCAEFSEAIRAHLRRKALDS